jgi:oxygen-independent coproporphyrinogen-3 oxidase
MALKFLGRAHGTAEARKAVEMAAAVFARHSIDLICARPGQSTAAWRRELGEALTLAGEHVSIYQLTIEPGTAFHRERVAPAAEDAAAAIYETTQEMLETAGLAQYEISNHARPGAECRHNLVYWRGGDYAGIGPGAHGRLTRNGVTDATAQIRMPGAWLAAVAAGKGGDHHRKPIPRGERRREMLLMGLRLAEGVSEQKCTGAIDEDQAGRLTRAGLIERADGRLRVRPAGRLMLDSILARLVL